MAQQIINVGTTANDGTGDLLRNGFIKVNQNFTELYTNRISGSGTDNYIPRFNGTNALENSIIFDNGTNVGIGTTSPTAKLTAINNASGWAGWIENQDTTGNGSGLVVTGASNIGGISLFVRKQDGTGTFAVLGNGNVGIGTTSPTEQLTISSGNIEGFDNVNLSALNSTTNGTVININSKGTVGIIKMTTNGGERMRITSSGNVGIGTTSPTAAKFVLNSGTSNQNALINGDKIGFTRTSDSAEVVYFKKDTSLGAEGTANINGYDGIQFRTQGAESVKAIITSGGNVGIGTTNPTEKLHVAGVAQILDDGTKGRITFQISSSQNDLFSTTTGFGAYRNLKLSSNELILSSGGTTERMRITSGGNVGIGTSSPTASAGYNTLSVNGSSGGQITLQTGNAIKGYIYNTSTSLVVGADLGNALVLDAGNTERMRITSGGDVFVGRTSNWVAVGTDKGLGLFSSGAVYSVVENDNAALFSRRSSDGDLILFRRDTNTVGSISVTTTLTSYNVTSDYRLKQDFKNFNGLELLSKIKVYDFAWNVDNSRMNGVIAHELQEVVPYAVTGEKDGEQMQQVDYSKLVPILIQSIQELKEEIETLKNK